MIYELTEYVWPCIIGLIIISLLLKKRTRKTTLKILIVIAIIIFVFIGIYLIGCQFFGDMFLVFYPLVIILFLLFYLTIVAIKELFKIVRLHKYGCRTTGTIVSIVYGRGSSYIIRYRVNHETYDCTSSRLTDKWDYGTIVPILFSEQNPQESCVEKHDLNVKILMTVVTSMLTIGAIAVGCVLVALL